MRKAHNKKSHAQFVKEVFDNYGSEYVVLGEYVNARTKIKMRHSICNYEYNVQPDSFLRGRRCPNCFGGVRKTHDQFVKQVDELGSREYKVIGTYKNARHKIEIKHVTCGHVWEIKPDNFINGKRCPLCYGNKKKTNEEFTREVFEKYGEEYSVIGEYVNTNTPIIIRHNVCGKEYETIPYAFLSGNGCFDCGVRVRSVTRRKSHEVFVKEVLNILGSDYEVISEYKQQKDKIKMKHIKCGEIYSMLPVSILRGSGCPKCNESRGEREVSKWLDKNKINYDRQYSIDQCRNIYPLKFDFVIFNDNGSIKCLIEYDGELHFNPPRYSDDKEKMLQKLKDVQHRDEIKNTFCIENDIPLLRIPYWDYDNISSILDVYLKS